MTDDTDGPINPFRKHKVTTVILTHKEIERLKFLRDRLGMRDSQLIRLGINRLYELEWELKEQQRAVAAKTASANALAVVLRR